MIIGIHGKKGHGKDTLAAIFRLLIALSKNPNAFFGKEPLPKEAYPMVIEAIKNENPKYQESSSGFIKKMFAGKVKEIVCLLIGCTMEQLEDQDFKEKPLGEEWTRFYIYNHTYALELGPFGSEEEAQAKLKWIKDYAPFAINNNTRLEIQKRFMTPRLLLQLIGTECGRKIIHPNVWVNATMSEYKPLFTYDDEYTGDEDNNSFTEGTAYANWIIPDVRFPNEVQAIKDRDGYVVKIWDDCVGHTGDHESETSLDHIPNSSYDYVFKNSRADGLNPLIAQATMFLKIKNII